MLNDETCFYVYVQRKKYWADIKDPISTLNHMPISKEQNKEWSKFKMQKMVKSEL